MLRRKFLGGAALTGSLGSLSSFALARGADNLTMQCRIPVHEQLLEKHFNADYPQDLHTVK